LPLVCPRVSTPATLGRFDTRALAYPPPALLRPLLRTSSGLPVAYRQQAWPGYRQHSVSPVLVIELCRNAARGWPARPPPCPSPLETPSLAPPTKYCTPKGAGTLSVNQSYRLRGADAVVAVPPQPASWRCHFVGLVVLRGLRLLRSVIPAKPRAPANARCAVWPVAFIEARHPSAPKGRPYWSG
jgi:hypothetical protein